MSDSSGPTGGSYVAQHLDLARLVSERVAKETGVEHPWRLVYQSRSGPPAQPWLEPDVSDHMRRLAAEGVPGVVVVPIGFVSDHMEVLFDLDVEAAAVAEELALPYVRAATVGADPRFVAMVRELVVERMEGTPGAERRALGDLGPSHDVCPAGCCPNLRAHLPAAAGED